MRLVLLVNFYKQLFIFPYPFFGFGMYFNSFLFCNFAIFIVIVVIFFLLFLSLFLSNSFFSLNGFWRLSSFECGFDPVWHSQGLFLAFHYYKISLIFLIFDLEILYFFPWLLVSKSFFMSGFFFFILHFFYCFWFCLLESI